MIFELAKPEDFEAVNRLAKQISQHHAQWDKSIQLDQEDYPMDFFRTVSGDRTSDVTMSL